MQESLVQKDGGHHRYMEHRWGARMPVSLAVQLEVPGCGRTPGVMVNASISGALIQTKMKPQPLSSLRLIVVTEHVRIELPACVARTTDEGFAVEWRDMACPELLEILKAHQGALSERDRTFG